MTSPKTPLTIFFSFSGIYVNYLPKKCNTNSLGSFLVFPTFSGRQNVEEHKAGVLGRLMPRFSHAWQACQVSVLSESEMAKYYQLQRVPRDADACVVVVITAWWTKLRRTSGDLKDLDKLGIDL